VQKKRQTNGMSSREEVRSRTRVARKDTAGTATTEDDDMEPLPSQPSGAHMFDGQSFLKYYMDQIEQLLVGLDPRWRNWIVRGIFSVLMIAIFIKLISFGPLAVSLLILAIQIKCFHEIITIGYHVYRSHNLPWFRSLSWIFLFTSNYWLHGENLIHHFGFLETISFCHW
jgi:hypothetical protein